MDGRQESKLNMYDAVITFCNDNAAIVATVPAFQTAVTSFQNIVLDLRTAAQNEIQAISGITVDKAEQKKELIGQAVDIGGAVFAYASSTDNFILKDKVRVNPSDLSRLKDELLAPACTNILNAAADNAAALIPFGVTAAKITAFETAINNYISAVPAPRNAVSNRVSVAGTIKQLFKDGDELLKEQLDKLAIQFKTTEPAFYNAYKSNRVILDAAVSSTQVAGTVADSVSRDPIFGATIQYAGLSLNTTSALDGSYVAKNPDTGIYSLIFTKSGYQDLTVPNIEVKLGQSTTLNVELVPVP